jgi:hypothetical protein
LEKEKKKPTLKLLLIDFTGGFFNLKAVFGSIDKAFKHTTYLQVRRVCFLFPPIGVPFLDKVSFRAISYQIYGFALR